jgi:hypothetical protein
MSAVTHGPVEARVRWEIDDAPYDWGDIDPTADDWHYLEVHGVWGCIVEIRPPACACCGRTDWQHGASLWGIVGDESYHREIERDLIAEVSA